MSEASDRTFDKAHDLIERLEERLKAKDAVISELVAALTDLVPRFEKCAEMSGSDPKFIAIATKQHRDAIAKATGGAP